MNHLRDKYQRILILTFCLYPSICLAEKQDEGRELIFKNMYSHPKAQNLRIDPRELGQKFAAISLEYQKVHSLDFSYPSKSSIQLSYLSGSLKNAFTIVGGKPQEAALLKNWILSRKDNSIDLTMLFKASLESSNGNIYRALLTAHDVLRNEARYTNKSYVVYESSAEQKKTFFNKFVDIRGDLEERAVGFKGDHSGSWYRFYGMQFKSYINSTKPNGQGIKKSLFLPRVRSANTSQMVETYKRIIGFPEPDVGKRAVNLAGAESNYYFMYYMKHPEKIPEDILSRKKDSYLKAGVPQWSCIREILRDLF